MPLSIGGHALNLFEILKNIRFTLDKIPLISSLVNSIYILATVDASVIGEARIGNENLEGWNSNTIGMMASYAAVIGVYMIFRTKKIFLKLTYLTFDVILLYVTIYSGSRKAFIIFLGCVVFIMFVKKPKAVFKNIIIVSLILYAAFYVCMNVESVYNVLGVRMEGLVSGITGEGEVDYSTMKRQEYIENGVEWFEESPIIGYGVNSYRLLNGKATGDTTYSHNNFVEMAINWGIIGFVLYYSIFVVVAVKLLRKTKGNLLASVIFSLLIVSTIMHYGMVTYYEVFPNMILCLACALAYSQPLKGDEIDVKKIN